MYDRKTPQEKRIEARIAVKDAREDAKQRSITVAWSINAALAAFAAARQNRESFTDDQIEEGARVMLRVFDKLFEERSQEQARRIEEEDSALESARLDAGDI